MLNFHVKIGLIPIRRDCTPRPGAFNWEVAEERGRSIVKYIKEHYSSENVSFTDLKGVNDVECLFSENDVEAVVNKMRAEKVDGIVIINANFGNEEVAALVTKELGLPVLLWAPLDTSYEPNGVRFTDSQCGVFGVSRQLQRNNIPFTYVECCSVDHEIFARGIDRFSRVVCMVKNFRGMRILQVGLRPKPFSSVIFNEGELMQRFGIRCIPLSMAQLASRYNKILLEYDDELEKGAELLRSRYELDSVTEGKLKKIYAFVILYKNLTEEFGVQAISAECWSSIELAVDAMPCIAYGILADMGYIVSCEADMHGAITMALLACASFGKNPSFFGEFTVRHPEDRSAELLWHCGQFAYSLKKPGVTAKTVTQRHWFEIKNSTYTLARMDQDDGKYMLLAGTCKSTEGPETNGTYLWAHFDNLDAWERKLIEGPYIHHMAEVEGDYTEELAEFCKFIPNLTLDTVK